MMLTAKQLNSNPDEDERDADHERDASCVSAIQLPACSVIDHLFAGLDFADFSPTVDRHHADDGDKHPDDEEQHPDDSDFFVNDRFIVDRGDASNESRVQRRELAKHLVNEWECPNHDVVVDSAIKNVFSRKCVAGCFVFGSVVIDHCYLFDFGILGHWGPQW